MNFAAFVDSLAIMGKGMLIIFGVMLIVWGAIALVRRLFK